MLTSDRADPVPTMIAAAVTCIACATLSAHGCAGAHVTQAHPQLVISGLREFDQDSILATDELVLRESIIELRQGASLTIRTRRLVIEGRNKIIGRGLSGEPGAPGRNATGPSSSGGCNSSCKDHDGERCLWLRAVSPASLDESLSQCAKCSSCMCGDKGSDGQPGGPGAHVALEVSEDVAWNGSLEADLRGGDGGIPGKGGLGLSIGGPSAMVRCSDGAVGRVGPEGRRGSCSLRLRNQKAAPCIPDHTDGALISPATCPPPKAIVIGEEEHGGLFGVSENSVFGGSCQQGFRRIKFQREVISGQQDGCRDIRWNNPDDPTDCSVFVHWGVAAANRTRCRVTVWVEQVNQPEGC